ncbi:hypothetical protein [Sansalvadorimonas verongulae]|uniref:hypothetical protein n=1 Tax=Sansalvadorimonas verongulae TaxID=2172824 RepID=UPI0012BC56C1|nr:hypothetical protein [Sansalvadorimonas verongulae]
MAYFPRQIPSKGAFHLLLLAFGILMTATTWAIDRPEVPGKETGLPIFHLDEHHLFELTIPDRGHPDTGAEIQDQLNRENATKSAEEEGREPLFPDALKPLNELRLRYKFKF